MGKQILDISTSSIIRVFVVLLVIAFILSIWPILASIFFAAVIASALEPSVRLLCKIKIPRFLAAAVLYLLIFSALASVFYLVVPALLSEARQLSLDLPSKYRELIKTVESFMGSRGITVNLQTQVQSFLSTIQFGFKGGVSNIFGFTSNVFGGMISVILVTVVSFYLVLQKNGIEQFLKSFLPTAHQEYATDLWKRVQEKIGRWFQTQLLLGVFTGTFLFLALWLMGVKYALTIALMAGVLEMIPMIGPLVTGLVMLALISFQSPMLALGAILIYVALEQVQQHFFMPVFISKALGLNPIVIIIALLVGSKLIGFWGILLAIPFAVAIGEVVRDFRK